MSATFPWLPAEHARAASEQQPRKPGHVGLQSDEDEYVVLYRNSDSRVRIRPECEEEE